MAGAAALLRDTLADRGIEACPVVGYSMGGRLALYFALHYPKHCTKLVLESASPGLRTSAERKVRRGRDEALAARLEAEPFEDFLAQWYRLPLFGSLQHHPEALDRMLMHRRRNQPAELAQSLRQMGTGTQPSLWERLHELNIPWLALAGALDPKFAAIGEAMTAVHPQGQFVQVPHAGHNIHLECMNAYIDLLQPFLINPGDAP